MPRMKAFDCGLFPLESASEINISDIEVLMTTVSEKLTVLDDAMDGVNRVLKQTHIGHEAHLWGQVVDPPVDDETEE